MFAGIKNLFSKGEQTYHNSTVHPYNQSMADNPTGELSSRSPLKLKVIGDLYYRHLAGVSATLKRPINAQEKEALDKIETLIKSQDKTPTLIPRMPGVIPKLIQLLRSDSYNTKDVSALISTDPALVAKVLSLVNSPYFRTSVPSNDIDQAIQQLGYNGLREIIMSVALKPIMQFDKGFFHQKAAKNIAELSQKVAIACRVLAKQTDIDPFDAYVAGLMHCTGSMAVLRKLNQISKVLELPKTKNFQQQAIYFAAQLSFLIAKQWEMSDPITTSLREQIDSDHQRPQSSLGQLLELGIRIAQLHTLASSGNFAAPSKILKIIIQHPLGKEAIHAYSALCAAEPKQTI